MAAGAQGVIPVGGAQVGLRAAPLAEGRGAAPAVLGLGGPQPERRAARRGRRAGDQRGALGGSAGAAERPRGLIGTHTVISDYFCK